MKFLRTCLAAVVFVVPLLASAATPRDAITGEWEFQADKPDPSTGNEEYLRMRLKLQDDGVVCGIFLSGWQGGKNIMQGFLRGRLRGDRIDEVTYDAGWNQLVGRGRGRLVLRKDRKLEWQVTRPFTTDYMVRKAVLEKGEPMLEEPPACR